MLLPLLLKQTSKMIHQLNPTMDVATPKGNGTAIMIIDYGIDVNTVWVVRFSGGKVLHFLSDDIRVWGNQMYGLGWDTDIPKEWENK